MKTGYQEKRTIITAIYHVFTFFFACADNNSHLDCYGMKTIAGDKCDIPAVLNLHIVNITCAVKEMSAEG